MTNDKWLLVRNRVGEIDNLTESSLSGKTVVDLVPEDVYRRWLQADKVWVNTALTKFKFELDGEVTYKSRSNAA